MIYVLYVSMNQMWLNWFFVSSEVSSREFIILVDTGYFKLIRAITIRVKIVFYVKGKPFGLEFRPDNFVQGISDEFTRLKWSPIGR